MKEIIVTDENLVIIGNYTGPFEKGRELVLSDEEFEKEDIQKLLGENRIKLKD